MKPLSSECQIDFVLPWVDGGDPAWLAEFERFAPTLNGDRRRSRYREWGTLRYLFRAFEQCTPWVRRIHFVTCGHLPEWLNTAHPKINIVKHADFLAPATLPIFNCNPIEVNLHRIEGLAEQFVYFNDDTFLLGKVSADRFFRNGLPRDAFCLEAFPHTQIGHIVVNDLNIIERHFDKRQVVRRNLWKLFDLRYGSVELAKNVLLLPWRNFTGFYNPHQPQPFLRSTFREVWDREAAVLEATSRSRVRSCHDVNQYLFRYWQLCRGRFVPASHRASCSRLVTDLSSARDAAGRIVSGRYDMVCVNDGLADDGEDLFAEAASAIVAALARLFPDKCGFER